MAQPSTLYRFRIDLSDVDRGIYETLDFRVAQHPSEAPIYLMTRVIAYALNVGEGVGFVPGGLSDPDSPCIQALSEHGKSVLWIEIGSPSARKLHKASKASDLVKVYTYKNPELLMNEVNAGEVHQVEKIEFYSIDQKFLQGLADATRRDNHWTLLRSDGSLDIGSGDLSFNAELKQHFPQSC
ncbi:MAG TPA: YaeQ family protein [Bdellovibrionota bacterium]|jgi:uncharacterized protein YaeQ|nr:YaeQ family protein [Bdellovibrionota bacterium]